MGWEGLMVLIKHERKVKVQCHIAVEGRPLKRKPIHTLLIRINHQLQIPLQRLVPVQEQLPERIYRAVQEITGHFQVDRAGYISKRAPSAARRILLRRIVDFGVRRLQSSVVIKPGLVLAALASLKLFQDPTQ